VTSFGSVSSAASSSPSVECSVPVSDVELRDSTLCWLLWKAFIHRYFREICSLDGVWDNWVILDTVSSDLICSRNCHTFISATDFGCIRHVHLLGKLLQEAKEVMLEFLIAKYTPFSRGAFQYCLNSP